MNRPHFKKDVTDQEIDILMRPHIANLMRYVTPRIQIDEKDTSTDNVNKKTTQKPSSQRADLLQIDITYEDKIYLESILDKPHLSITRRADDLGLSSYMNNKLKKRALQGNLVVEFPLNFGYRSRGIVKFLELTPAGFQAIGEKPPKAHGYRCSPEHWFWQRRIRDHYKSQGFPVEIEMELNGKRADVGFFKDGLPIAVEVGITAKNETVNAQKDIEAGFANVLLACKNSQVKKAVETRIQKSLDTAALLKVKIITLSEFSFVEKLMKG